MSNESRTECDFPILNDYEQWLIDTTKSIGLSHGGKPISFVEIESWCSLSGISLSIWEAENIKSLSGIFVDTYRTSEKLEVAPPLMSKERHEQLAKLHARRRIRELERQLEKQEKAERLNGS